MLRATLDSVGVKRVRDRVYIDLSSACGDSSRISFRSSGRIDCGEGGDE